MFGIVGTVPENDFPMISDTVILEEDQIIFGDKRVAVDGEHRQ